MDLKPIEGITKPDMDLRAVATSDSYLPTLGTSGILNGLRIAPVAKLKVSVIVSTTP